MTRLLFSQLNLSISGGSCFLESSVNDSRIVEVIHPPPGLQCSQLMLSPRGLGTALVTVNDIGLTPPLVASARVKLFLQTVIYDSFAARRFSEIMVCE